MRVAIDQDTMEVLHVHRVQDLLHGLVLLEHSNVKRVLFDDTERPLFLSTLTTLQLNALFSKLSGVPFPPTVSDDLQRRELVAVVVNALKPPLVDERELELQLAAVEAELRKPPGQVPQFRYHLGSKVPRVVEGSFTRKGSPPDPKQVAAAAQRAPQQRAPHPVTTAAPAPVPRTAPARAAGSPRPSGGATNVIWQVADRLWVEAGKPRAVPVVLLLRKKAMEVLETEHGVKKTTSSTSLGNWMKDRLSKAE